MNTEIPLVLSPKPMYDVVSPCGELMSHGLSYAHPVPDLQGRKIGLVWAGGRDDETIDGRILFQGKLFYFSFFKEIFQIFNPAFINSNY